MNSTSGEDHICLFLSQYSSMNSLLVAESIYLQETALSQKHNHPRIYTG